MGKEEKFSLEQAFDALEGIIAKLEEKEVPLETLLEEYEKGVLLISACQKRLLTAEKKVEILQKQVKEIFEPSSIEEEGLHGID